MNGCHVREVNAAKMFSIVAIMLFICHIISVIDFIVGEITQIIHREFLLSIMLTVAVNAASNFFVYYTFAQDFKEYFWLLVGSKVWTSKPSNKYGLNPVDENSMLGRVSPGDEMILHESVRYTKTFEREEQNEQSKLLNAQ